jgi:N-acetylmuramoyl-L-alanine amidase
VVDAGHGGDDEGTSITTRAGARITEKSITLGVATFLGEELRKRGFDVLQTRARDTLISLHDRGRIANDKEGSAFISIHVNAAGTRNSAARGVETYFLSAARTEDDRRLQAIENSSARFEDKSRTAAQTDNVSIMLRDMLENQYLRESSRLATSIQSTLSRAHPGGDRGVKQAEFAVLVGAFMPAALVEIGFLSNEKDAIFLVKKENQRKIAVAIADATSAYFKGYDRRVIAAGDGK